MRRWTLAEIRSKIEQDLDLEAEDFVTRSEINALINEAIDECEAHIHGLGREQEYFLARGSLSLVQGQDTYDLPADIYANKILKVVYSEGATIYDMKRLRSLGRFAEVEIANKYEAGTDYYRYLILHESAANDRKILVVPTPTGPSGPHKVWYIRNANRLVADTDVCDIPEFVHMVIARVKRDIYVKEGSPQAEPAQMEYELQKQLMISTLGEMVPDDDNEIIKDFSHYEDAT